MNCNYCNAQLNDDALICSDCGDRIAERVQTKKINDLKENLSSVFSSNFKSTFALILAIAMSVIALCNLISAITSLPDFFGFGLSILSGVIALINAISIWKLWSSKTELNSKSINALNGYISLQRVLNIIILVLFEIFGALLLLLALALTVAIDSLGDILGEITDKFGTMLSGEGVAILGMINNVISMGGPILLAIVIALIAIVTIYILLFNRTLKKSINYIKSISNAVEYGAYKTQEEPPYISLFIFGGLNVISGILAGGIMGLLSGLAFGAYLIVSALLFKNIHEEAQKHNASIEAETAVLEDITRRTDLFIAQTVAAKRATQAAPAENVAE